MSWLFIDTHERGVSRWGWIDPGASSWESRKRNQESRRGNQEAGNGRQSLQSPVSSLQTILGSAGQLLNAFAKERKRLSSAKGVCVVAGPGSFSSVRTGVLYANLLSRLFRIPLVGVTVEEAKDLDALSGRLLDTRYAIRDTRYVAPLYDAEPNITIPQT